MKKIIVLLALAFNFSAHANGHEDATVTVPTKVTCAEAKKEDHYKVAIVHSPGENVDYAFIVRLDFNAKTTSLVNVVKVSGKSTGFDTIYSDENNDIQLRVQGSPEGVQATLNATSLGIQQMPLSCQSNSTISFDKPNLF